MTSYIAVVEYPHGVETFGPFATVSFSSVVAARRGKRGGTSWVFNERGEVMFQRDNLTGDMSRALHPSNWPGLDDA